jgi:hypothetical protein
LLEEEYWSFQKTHILKLIQMYESGQLGSLSAATALWLRDGVALESEPGIGGIPKGSAVWFEVCFRLYLTSLLCLPEI